jgi:hypothetical protein
LALAVLVASVLAAAAAAALTDLLPFDDIVLAGALAEPDAFFPDLILLEIVLLAVDALEADE